MRDNKFTYEIIKNLGVLSASNDGRFQIEANIISYNGTAPKLDVRKWDKEKNRFLKGIVLTRPEAEALRDILVKSL